MITHPPLPHQLVKFPELAALELLDAALTVARNALLAVHPAVASERFTRALPIPVPLACLADSITAQVEALQTTLNRYRNLVAHAQESDSDELDFVLNARKPEDDLPF